MSRKVLLRAGLPAVAASAMLFSMSGVANASVAPTAVVADSACQALELTKIIDGHDHMFVDPTVDNSDCYFMIIDGNNGDTVYLTMSPAGDQPQPDGVYDGPGVRLYVEVADPGIAHADGPVN